MPLVTLRMTVEGREEILTEYMCDWTDCPNVAVEVVGNARELRLCRVLCAEHAKLLSKQRDADSRR
jgi:hypothetical protein